MSEQSATDSITFTFEDELSIYTANELKEKIIEMLPSTQALNIDLSKVTEMDSAGLQLLFSLKEQLPDHQIVFKNHSPAVLEVLETCGLAGYFDDAVVISPEVYS